MRLGKYLAHSGVASRRERRGADRRRPGAGRRRGRPRPGARRRVRERGGGRRPPGRPRAARGLDPEQARRGRPRPRASRGARRAVTELIDSKRRLYPVGRLDADSTGLILVTNDGELANRLTHPRYEVPRTYRAPLRRAADRRRSRPAARGVELDDGPTAPARVRRVSAAGARDHDPRGAQPPGAADGRGDRQRGGRARADRLRPAAARASWRPGSRARLRAAELRRLWKDPRR